MNVIPKISFVDSVGSYAHFRGGTPSPFNFALSVATGATLVSLGIAICSGWQSGGLLIECIMRIALAGIAVLVVHWLPAGWSTFRGLQKLCAVALWIVATVVVLFGQMTFFMVAQRHAGDLRAAMVPAPAVPTDPDLHTRRSRTEIARETANVSAALAHAQRQSCIGDCSMLKVRRVRLAAEVAALSVEAEEAKRREAAEDRRTSQDERDDDRREQLRADPVAFPVASWLGTTEPGLQLIVGFAFAVVLEGAAILGWAFVAVAPSRGAGRCVIAPDTALGTPNPGLVTEVAPSRADPSEEDLLLVRIRAAVVAGGLNPTQNAIRNFLRCGQSKAGKLNRLYMEKFGSMRGLAVAHRQNAVLNRQSIEVVK